MNFKDKWNNNVSWRTKRFVYTFIIVCCGIFAGDRYAAAGAQSTCNIIYGLTFFGAGFVLSYDFKKGEEEKAKRDKESGKYNGPHL